MDRSVDAMWNIGAQAAKVPARDRPRSSAKAVTRAIKARWEIRAAFGWPVVPLV